MTTEHRPANTVDIGTDVVRKVAYDTADKPDRGYSVRASYLDTAAGVGRPDALIEVSKGGALVRSFLYPAYRIYNIAAHFDELVDSLIEAEGVAA